MGKMNPIKTGLQILEIPVWAETNAQTDREATEPHHKAHKELTPDLSAFPNRLGISLTPKEPQLWLRFKSLLNHWVKKSNATKFFKIYKNM